MPGGSKLAGGTISIGRFLKNARAMNLSFVALGQLLSFVHNNQVASPLATRTISRSAAGG